MRNSKCYLIAPRSGEGARVSVESGGVLWQETDGGNGVIVRNISKDCGGKSGKNYTGNATLKAKEMARETCRR